MCFIMNINGKLVIIILIIIIISLFLKLLKNEKIMALYRITKFSKSEISNYHKSYDNIFSRYDMILSLDDFKKGRINNIGFNPPNSEKEIVNCYNILNDLCTLGNVQKMYIPPLIDSKLGFKENQNLNEISIVNKLKVKANSKLLELGCGTGKISEHISKVFNCTVYGINIDKNQLNKAKIFSKENNSKTIFKYGNFSKKLDFENEYFDGIYSVQPLTYSNDLVGTFKELYRVLKPGKRISIQDLAMLNNFDKTNKDHMKMAIRAREVMEAGGMWHYSFWNYAIEKAGFKIISSGPAKNIYNLNVPDLPLLKSEHANYDRINKFIKFLQSCKLIPNHISALIKRLRDGAEDLIKMEEKELLTMNWNIVLEKPKYN